MCLKRGRSELGQVSECRSTFCSNNFCWYVWSLLRNNILWCYHICSIIFVCLFFNYHDGQIRESGPLKTRFCRSFNCCCCYYSIIQQVHCRPPHRRIKRFSCRRNGRRIRRGSESSVGPAVQINRFWPLNMSTVHGYLNPWYGVLIADPPSPGTLNQYSKTCLERHLRYTASCYAYPE